MPKVELSLICHAPTRATREAAFPADEPLDPQVRAMAKTAAGKVRRVDAAWSSPALRARQTADALGLAVQNEPLLRDLDYGRWTGHSLDAVAAADPSAVAVWLSDTGAAPHGGETVDDLFGRIAIWLGHAADWNGRIVAVTHATVIRAAIVTVLEANRASFWRIDIAPLCCVRLRGHAGRWTLLSIGK